MEQFESILDGGWALEQHSDLIRRVRVIELPKRTVESIPREQDEIRDIMLSAVPKELQAEAQPYSDGSIVFYRPHDDFYDVHHDSWSPGDPIDTDHRAYTLLVYLRTPSYGTAANGGTEFIHIRDGKGLPNHPLTFRPTAGDALLWPNFNREGFYSNVSEHRALPVSTSMPLEDGRRFERGLGGDMQGRNNGDTGLGDKEEVTLNEHDPKLVLNMWFGGVSETEGKSMLI